MKIGIVGLPNVGKSTLFKAITKNQVDINNYPFCTIEPNVGVVEVPDERLDKLAEMSKSKKVVHAIVEFVDIAGLVKGAAEGEGLGNKFLANIREVDAIVQVVRAFPARGGSAFGGENVTHVYKTIDPQRDIEVINTELVLADLETINKRIDKLEREAKKGDKESVAKLEVNKKIKETLELGELANKTELNMGDENTKIAVKELSLLTMKSFLYVYNVSDIDKKLDEELEKKPHIKLDIKIEEEMDEMSAEEKKELGIESGLDKLIIESYKVLNLITFLTTGEAESRAWTIKKDSIAPEAGAAIHNDFKDNFICADVIRWDELLKLGSMSKAREAGKVQTAGKDYVVQDGDVVEFKVGA